MSETAPATKNVPPEVAALYKPLWREVAWLFAKWRTYIRLFGTSEDDLAVLNRAAGSFVALIQNVMVGDLIIAISRLTDAKGTGQRTNLSLDALTQAVDAAVYPSLRAELDRCVSDAHERAAFARDWRNRQVAHLDLRTALGTHAEPLSRYTRAQVQSAIETIAETLNKVSKHFDGNTTMFSEFIHGHGSAESLIRHLRRTSAARGTC